MPDLERVQQNTPTTLSHQWYESGAAVDPGTVTLGITRADGTELVAPGASTSGTGTSPRTYNLTTTHTALLDKLKVTWTSTLKGTLVSYVEVVGGFLFTIAQLTAIKPGSQTWTTAQMEEKRIEVEQAIEDQAGVAFVPRYSYETFDGPGSLSILLKPRTRVIRSATIAGTAVSADELAELTYVAAGSTYGVTWTFGYGNVTIGYEHGYDNPPGRIKNAALMLAKSELVQGPVDDRAATFSSADGGTYGLVVAGRGGSHFGLPYVDTAVEDYSIRSEIG
jgi:hypothetical protein